MLVRRMITVVSACTAALTIGAGTALAGQDSIFVRASSSDCDKPSGDPTAAEGMFRHAGDSFTIQDICADGHSAVIQVDAKPWGTANSFDWKLHATGGLSSKESTVRNYTEGTDILVRACIYEGSTKLNCGAWDMGTA